MDGTGVFLGQIDIVQATDPGVAKTRAVQKSGDDLPVIEVETRRGFSGKIVAWVQAIFGDEEQEISVALLESYWLEFEDIKGLYKPDGSYEKGYSSDDGLGRVYNHWKFQPDDPSQGEFRRFERSVSIEVRVHPEDKPIPDGVLVKWEALDPDDDSDEDPSVVLFAGCRIDPGDYDSDCTERADPIGGRGGDNLGFRGYSPWWERERLPDGTPDPTYEFAEFEISMPPPIPSTWFATTSVHENTSKVKFNLTDAGGDNFQVEASLVPADDVFDSRSPAATGVFTLWKRIFVEYRRMGDLSVPWSEEGLRGLLNDRYKLAFVEYKIPEPLGQATDYPFLRPKPQYPGFYEYVGLWDGVGLGQFHHRQDELWHFLGHARLLDETSDGEVILPVDTPGIQAVEFLSPTELRLLTGDTFSTGSLKGLALVLSTTDGHRITFTIALNDADMITIEPFSYGVIDTAPFFSIDLVAPSWLAFRNDFFVIAEGGGRTIGATETGGVAFLVFNEAIDIMAAKPEAPPWAEICQETIVHELVHTYDTRDNCGRTATDGSKCMMTYDFVPALTLDQNGSVEGLDWDLSGGSSICPEHILAIRKSDREGSY